MATKTYAQIAAQIQALTKEGEALKAKEGRGVIDRIKEAIATYGLTASDLGLAGGKRGPKPGAAAKKRGRPRGAGAKQKKGGAPKFADGSGNVWVGRGPRPKWIKEALAAGKSLEDFAQKTRA